MGEEYHRVAMAVLVHCLRGFLRLICLIIDGINLDHLLKVLSTVFFYCKVNMITFVNAPLASLEMIFFLCSIK